MNPALPRPLLLALWLLPLAVTPIGHGEHGTPLSRLVKAAEESGWVPLRVTMIPGTYHYLAILARQGLFPAEKPRQDGKAKKKSAKKQPGKK